MQGFGFPTPRLMKNLDYSVVIPILNQSKIIPKLWSRLSDVKVWFPHP